MRAAQAQVNVVNKAQVNVVNKAQVNVVNKAQVRTALLSFGCPILPIGVRVNVRDRVRVSPSRVLSCCPLIRV